MIRTSYRMRAESCTLLGTACVVLSLSTAALTRCNSTLTSTRSLYGVLSGLLESPGTAIESADLEGWYVRLTME